MRVGQQRAPDIAAAGVWLHEGLARTAANQAVIPTEIVVEHGAEAEWLTGLDRPQGLLSRFRFETTAAERADDSSIGQENRLGTAFLRGRTFGLDQHRKR